MAVARGRRLIEVALCEEAAAALGEDIGTLRGALAGADGDAGRTSR
jgi:hypothetical protein